MKAADDRRSGCAALSSAAVEKNAAWAGLGCALRKGLGWAFGGRFVSLFLCDFTDFVAASAWPLNAKTATSAIASVLTASSGRPVITRQILQISPRKYRVIAPNSTSF